MMIRSRSFVNRDEKLNAKSNTVANLYHRLHKRQKKLLRDVGDYFDVDERFNKEESKAYLIQKEEADGLYATQLAKYAKDSHRRHISTMRSKTNLPYLAYAEKIVAKFSL